MIFYHDSRNPIYRTPMGAAACGTALTLRVRGENLVKVWLRLWWQDAEARQPMRRIGAELFEYEFRLPDTPGLLWYFFIAEDDEGSTWYLGNASDGLGGIGEVSLHEPAGYQITVYDGASHSPVWLRDGMMMQIMVDRFHRSGPLDVSKLPPTSFYHQHWDDNPTLIINDDKYGYNINNDFFGGNLRGVIEKLDYIRSLGVTVLYFNPIFKARSNHKYDTGDYRAIDPSFGTEEDFRELCQAAADRGIRVILDGVFSHTGADSLYFNRDGNYGPGGAFNDPASPYAAWYRFRSWPDDYECWWGFKTLPNVHEETESYQDFIINDDDSVAAHWLRAGAAGWRLDVADELPMDFIRRLRTRVRQVKPDAAIIGEVWEDPSNKIAYDEQRCYCLGDTLDCTMNYPLRTAILDVLCRRINAAEFVRQVESQRENLPAEFYYSQMNILGTHDTPRAINVLADVGEMSPERELRKPMQLEEEAFARGRRRMIAGWTLLCAMPGMPCLYYGDEAGMTGMADPYCRGTYPWGQEDLELREIYRGIMNDRMHCAALRTGEMQITAVGMDVVLLERRISGGMDAFGNAAQDGARVLAVNRADEYRRVEYDNRIYDIPAESAKWLPAARRLALQSTHPEALEGVSLAARRTCAERS